MNRSIYSIDPLRDSRWSDLIARHPNASVFHTGGWLKALHDTYGYKPVVFTTSAPSVSLTNGLVFCRISSWLTGRRIVSLPFSDHCDPLFDNDDEFQFLLNYLLADFQHEKWKYLEFRPINEQFFGKAVAESLHPYKTYCGHLLDIRPDLDFILRGFHKDSVQRRIRRAERANLSYERGTSDGLLREFYGLLVTTRARHRLPPQPLSWFRNLTRALGDAFELRVARVGRIPIAAVGTLRFRNAVYYKYGCSNPRFNNLGAMPFLLWRTIEESKAAGATLFDFGRTDTDHNSLLRFKEHWAPRSLQLTYWRFPASSALVTREARNLKIVKRLCSWMPEILLTGAGRMIYRHIG